MPYKNFEPGEVFFAKDVQEYLQDQGIMIFSSSAARDAAFTSASSLASSAYPIEGMVTYIGSGSAEFWSGSAWEVWPS